MISSWLPPSLSLPFEIDDSYVTQADVELRKFLLLPCYTLTSLRKDHSVFFFHIWLGLSLHKNFQTALQNGYLSFHHGTQEKWVNVQSKQVHLNSAYNIHFNSKLKCKILSVSILHEVLRFIFLVHLWSFPKYTIIYCH